MCQEGRECGFRIPRLKDFEREGLFENVKLPLYENKELPINLKKYIQSNSVITNSLGLAKSVRFNRGSL